ncbi:MAG: riboflavin kinase [Phycisphaerales bacterium]
MTIGNFDGVHLGHRALIEAARRLVDSGHAERVVAMVFFPHPAIALGRPEQAPSLISNFGQRKQWLQHLGADEVIQLDPHEPVPGAPVDKVIDMTAQQFVSWLVRTHNTRGFVEGSDFRFGKGRQGSIETLRDTAKDIGGIVQAVENVEVMLSDGSRVPAQRRHPQAARIRPRVRRRACARKTLRDPRRVTQGDRRGRTIGFPTANITPACDLPGDGVYACLAELPDGTTVPAAVSVGTNPTFTTSKRRTLEAHLLGVGGPDRLIADNEYGWPIRLEFLEWIRAQATFTTLDGLITAIRHDCERVEKIAEATKRAATARNA